MSTVISEKQRIVKLDSGRTVTIKTIECNDDNGESFDIDIQAGAYVEIIVHNCSGCIVFSPAQAREFAAKILAEVPE